MTARSSEATVYQQTLIDKLVGEALIVSPPVEVAFRAIPRHLFLPDVPLEQAYEDRAIPTKFADGRPISSSSQPAIMALMLEQLELQPGHRVLEIGAGTGYNAALMAHIVGATGQVTTLDIDADIVAAAQQHLQTANISNVQVICTDGTLGWPEAAPYDRIILSVGGWDISPDWVEQLREDGRLVLPLSLNGPQFSAAFMPAGDHLTSDSLLPCGFMRLRGPFAEPEYELTLGPVPHMGLIAHRPLPQRAKDFYTWLKAPHQPRPTGVIISRRKMGQSLLLWLALQEPRLCHLFAREQAATMGLVPTLFSQTEPDPWQSSVGLWLENGLAMLQQQPTAEADTFELEICGYGPDTLAAQRLVAEVQAWQTNGRPDIGGWVIDAYPLATPYTPKYNEAVLPKRWHQFILRWRDNE